MKPLASMARLTVAMTILLGLLAAPAPAQYAKYDTLITNLLEEGVKHLNNREYKKAIRNFRTVRQADPARADTADSLIELAFDKIEEEKEDADKARQQAERAREQISGFRLAIEAVEELDEGNTTLAACMAREAFRLNMKYGDRFPNEIYNALRKTLNGLNRANHDLEKGGPDTLAQHASRVPSIVHFPGGEIAWSSNDSLYRAAWSSNDRLYRLIPQMTKPNLIGRERSISQLALTPDGTVLAAVGDDGTVALIRLAGNQRLPDPPGYLKNIFSVAFDANGASLALGTWDTSLMLWDLNEQQPDTLTGHEHREAVLSVAFSPDGNYLASGSREGTITLWDLTPTPPKVLDTDRLPVPSSSVWSMAFSPDSKTLASGDAGGNVLLWRVGRGTLEAERRPLDDHKSPISVVAFSSDGAWLASGSTDQSIRLWNLKHRAENPVDPVDPIALKEGTAWILALTFGRDDQQLISSSADGIVRSWRLDPEALNEALDEALKKAGHQCLANAGAPQPREEP